MRLQIRCDALVANVSYDESETRNRPLPQGLRESLKVDVSARAWKTLSPWKGHTGHIVQINDSTFEALVHGLSARQNKSLGAQTQLPLFSDL